MTGCGYSKGYISDMRPTIILVKASLSSEKNKLSLKINELQNQYNKLIRNYKKKGKANAKRRK